MNRFLKSVLFCSLFWLWISGSIAEEISKEQIKGIDEQVQDIKKDMLGISVELNLLEEKLIYPSSTQILVFVALAKNDKFHLNGVDIKVNGKNTTHHIYTAKELEALQSGGVQRLYAGNIRTGEHTLDVSYNGKTSSKNDYQQNAIFKFTKTLEPKLIEVTLSGPDSGNQHIVFKD